MSFKTFLKRSSRRFAAWPQDVKVVFVAGLFVIGSFVAVLPFIDMEDQQVEEASSAVAANAHNGRLLFGVQSVALGSAKIDGGTESTQWAGLHRAEGRADLDEGTISSLASGPIALDPLNEAKLTFRSAAYVKDGILHELIIPQDTLRLRIPGEPGHPGDTLLITFDVGRSVADEAGLLIFRPFVSEAKWIRPPTPEETAAAMPGAGNKTTPGVVPEGMNYGSDDLAKTTSGQGTDRQDRQNEVPKIGRASFYVHDAVMPIVETLHADFVKVAVGPVGGAPADAAAYFEGSKVIDLRAHEGPEERAHLVTFQLPAGEYGTIHYEFGTGAGRIGMKDETLQVPQPQLVLETPFRITAGETTQITSDFSIPESLVRGGDGWEFRPVVSGINITGQEEETHTPGQKPPQYRTGGGSLPSMGETNSLFIYETTGRDPEETGEQGQNATGTRGLLDRPIGSGGSATDPGDPDDVVGNVPPGTAIATSNGQHHYLVEALSRNLLPSKETLDVLDATEVSRLDHLPVMLVVGRPGIGSDLRALPGVIHVEEDVARAPFP